MTRKALRVGLAFALVVCAGLSLARGDDPSPFDKRVSELAGLFTKDLEKWDDLFSPEFLEAVPPARIKSILVTYRGLGGKVTRTSITAKDSAFSGKLDLVFEKGVKVVVSLTVDGAAPHRVIGLLLGPPIPLARSLKAVIEELRGLPGKKSLKVVRLAPEGEPATVAELDPDEPLAIASAFKLYVLAQLGRDVAEGKRTFADVARLERDRASLPSGMIQSWPDGAPATLHTLATLMISISDNTATDLLIRALGRERIEAGLAASGHAKPALNAPFLTTLELFTLKGDGTGARAKAWASKDAAARRAFLDQDLARVRRESVSFTGGGKPQEIETIEWFASAADLCRVMERLRALTEQGPAAPARDVLAVNRGLGISTERWPYVGFKGGSEPGVMNLTFLLRSRQDDWYAVSAGWNDPKARVDETRFVGLVERLIELLPQRY